MSDPDLLDHMRSELKKLDPQHQKRARAARPKLEALLKSRPASLREPHRRILILLEAWQEEAIRLLLEIRGGWLQRRLREWLTAAIYAEARRAGIRLPASRV